ncbi:MAG: PRC-barrel domain-containing protein [Candidatus Diapherotrites archaeon]|nr:PRC-barrel domain-containing protein [Candidatus Diapherotrites archaeon]
MHISELYGIDIYNFDDAKYIGKVNDVILNLETGKIVRLTTEPLRSISKDKAKEILREKSVLYKNVLSVGDIVIVGRGKRVAASEEEATVASRTLPARRSLLGRTR